MTAGDIAPGDVITFGDHTGWYRVLWVDTFANVVTIYAWFRRARTVDQSTPVWEKP